MLRKTYEGTKKATKTGGFLYKPVSLQIIDMGILSAACFNFCHSWNPDALVKLLVQWSHAQIVLY